MIDFNDINYICKAGTLEWNIIATEMDYTDMDVKPSASTPELLDPALWKSSDPLPRSKEISPIYVCRYRGPRKGGPPSRHPYWELSAVMNGELEMILSEGKLPLRKGDVFLAPKGLAHSELSAEPADTIWIAFEGAIDEKAFQKAASVSSEELCQEAERLWLLSRRKSGVNGSELDGATRKLFGAFCGMLGEGAKGEAQPVAERAASMLNARFREGVQMPELAESLGVSEGHFFRVFKARYGQTPVEYLMAIRMEEAAQLLVNTEAPVSEIAELCGYKDQFYFSRVFSKRFGRSPSAYRLGS